MSIARSNFRLVVVRLVSSLACAAAILLMSAQAQAAQLVIQDPFAARSVDPVVRVQGVPCPRGYDGSCGQCVPNRQDGQPHCPGAYRRGGYGYRAAPYGGAPYYGGPAYGGPAYGGPAYGGPPGYYGGYGSRSRAACPPGYDGSCGRCIPNREDERPHC